MIDEQDIFGTEEERIVDVYTEIDINCFSRDFDVDDDEDDYED